VVCYSLVSCCGICCTLLVARIQSSKLNVGVLVLVSDKMMLGVSVDRMKYLTIDNSVLCILQCIICSSTHAACIDGAACVGVIGSGGS
jgi:hypothetical protein